MVEQATKTEAQLNRELLEQEMVVAKQELVEAMKGKGKDRAIVGTRLEIDSEGLFSFNNWDTNGHSHEIFSNSGDDELLHYYGLDIDPVYAASFQPNLMRESVDYFLKRTGEAKGNYLEKNREGLMKGLTGDLKATKERITHPQKQ